MEVEKYMIHVGAVLEDPDMCFAHLLEGKEKKETLQEHTKLCQKYWKRMVEQRGLVSIFDNFKNRYLQEISEEGKYLFDVMTVNIVTWHDFGKCNPRFQKDKRSIHGIWIWHRITQLEADIPYYQQCFIWIILLNGSISWRTSRRERNSKILHICILM